MYCPPLKLTTFIYTQDCCLAVNGNCATLKGVGLNERSRKLVHLVNNNKNLYLYFSEMIAIDRRAQDRFITLVPVLDVDDNVTGENLESMWQTFQEILTCFPNLT